MLNDALVLATKFSCYFVNWAKIRLLIPNDIQRPIYYRKAINELFMTFPQNPTSKDLNYPFKPHATHIVLLDGYTVLIRSLSVNTEVLCGEAG